MADHEIVDEPDLGAVIERLWLAVEVLATSAEPLRQRSLHAYSEHLGAQDPAEFDSKTKADFKKLKALAERIIDAVVEKATPTALEGHSEWESPAKKIRDSAGKKIAQMISSLCQAPEEA